MSKNVVGHSPFKSFFLIHLGPSGEQAVRGLNCWSRCKAKYTVSVDANVSRKGSSPTCPVSGTQRTHPRECVEMILVNHGEYKDGGS